MSFLSTLNTINTQTAQAAATVATVVQMVEVMAPPDATGGQKADIAIQVISQALAGSSNARISGIATTVNIAVSVANLFKVFTKKVPATAQAVMGTGSIGAVPRSGLGTGLTPGL